MLDSPQQKALTRVIGDLEQLHTLFSTNFISEMDELQCDIPVHVIRGVHEARWAHVLQLTRDISTQINLCKDFLPNHLRIHLSEMVEQFFSYSASGNTKEDIQHFKKNLQQKAIADLKSLIPGLIKLKSLNKNINTEAA